MRILPKDSEIFLKRFWPSAGFCWTLKLKGNSLIILPQIHPDAGYSSLMLNMLKMMLKNAQLVLGNTETSFVQVKEVGSEELRCSAGASPTSLGVFWFVLVGFFPANI